MGFLLSEELVAKALSILFCVVLSKHLSNNFFSNQHSRIFLSQNVVELCPAESTNVNVATFLSPERD